MRNLASIRIEKTGEMLGDFVPAIFFIPNKGEQLVRYYGAYSNVSTGKRKKEEDKKDVIGKPEFVEVAPPPISKELKKRW